MTDTTQDVNTEVDAQDADADVTNQANEQDSQPTGFDALPPETQAEIKKLRRENASYRTKVKSYEEANQTEAEKRESELKAAREQANAATSELQELRAKTKLQDVVSNMPNVYDAPTVIDLAMPLLTFDGNGQPDNIEEALETLKERRPKLFPAARGAADGGKGAPPASNDFNQMIRRAAGRK